VIEWGHASAGIQKWRKWTNEKRSTPHSGSVDQTDQGRAWDQHPDHFHHVIDLGPFPSTTRGKDSADLAD
jgi:hypothetical protein